MTINDEWDMDNTRGFLPQSQTSPTPLPTLPEQGSSSLAAQHPSTPDLSVSVLHPAGPIDDDHYFMLDGPVTCIGQKWKARDLQAILRVCTCGQAVTHEETSISQNIIKCTSTGCETGWVSERIE